MSGWSLHVYRGSKDSDRFFVPLLGHDSQGAETVAKRRVEENEIRSLDVYLHGERIGTVVQQTPAQGPSFRYTEAYRTRPGALALGKQLPLQEAASESSTILRWIDGLLPEGERRAHLAEQVGQHRMSTMSLIREIGLDCAGAVQIVPAGSRIGTPRYEETSTEEIARAFDEIASRPIGAFDRGARLSIAGAQEKLVLARRPNGYWAWPINGAASTHILKPEMKRFPGLVENEHLCMTIAMRAGLPAARVEIERFGDYPTLVVERYDRTSHGTRIHQEDFAQALGTPGKYQQHGGPSLKDCFEKTDVDGWALWNQVIFAWIIGDEDKHAKNCSIMYAKGHPPRLAPIYDAVCTLAYPDLDRGMAMRIGHTYHIRGVNEGAIRNQAERCGLDPDEAAQRTHALAKRVRGAVAALRKEGWDTTVVESTGAMDRCDQACEWTA